MENEIYDDYLYHYGVLGMKWGVRHDKHKAYEKSIAKKAKLEKRATVLAGKLQKSQYKAQRSALLGKKNASKKAMKATKALKKSIKANKKYQKWTKAMVKNFDYEFVKNYEPDDKTKKIVLDYLSSHKY